MPSFCILCNTSGHVRQECNNNPVSWNEYIDSLKDTGIPSHLFDPVAENSIYTPSSANNTGPSSSTPRTEAITRSALRSILQELALEGQLPILNQSLNTNPVPNLPGPSQSPIVAAINPIPRPPVTRSRRVASVEDDDVQIVEEIPAGRGRGRGRGANTNNISHPILAPRGRGRGRGQNSNQNQQTFYWPNNTTSRGRGYRRGG
jgi:hypothetical protein